MIDLIADPLDTGTNEEKARAAGFSPRTLYNVMNDPEALRILQERTDHFLRMYRPAAYRCLVQNFRGGDRASARDYLQAIGDIGTGGQHNVTNVINTTDKDEPLDDAIAREQLERRQTALREPE